MLKYTFIAILLAFLLYVVGLTSVVLVSTIIILGSFILKHMNNGTITNVSTLLTIGAMLAFIVLIFLDFFGKITTTATILITILIILVLSWIGSASEKNYSEVLILTIVLIIFLILAPILNAWTPILSDKTQNIQAQLGISEKTEGTFSAMSDGMSDIWLMLTDPAKWQENKNNDLGKQEGGDLALEITSVKSMPTTVMPEDEYTMMFELKNLGKNDATTVKVGARVEARALKHGSYIIDSNNEDKNVAWLYLSIDDVHPQEQRFESFDIVAPNCAGTFTTTSYVEYSYNAIATTNLELIWKTEQLRTGGYGRY